MEKTSKTIMKLNNGNLLVRDGKLIRIVPEKDYRKSHNSVKITQDGRGK